jgi:hypothetical protein
VKIRPRTGRRFDPERLPTDHSRAPCADNVPIDVVKLLRAVETNDGRTFLTTLGTGEERSREYVSRNANDPLGEQLYVKRYRVHFFFYLKQGADWYRIGYRAPTPRAESVPVRKRYFIMYSRIGSRLMRVKKKKKKK